MPIYCNYYDIQLYQGQSFFLDLNYQDDNDDPVDLRGTTYEATMQVRRSPLVRQKLLSLSSGAYPEGVTGGGGTGQFLGTTSDPGRTGTGGISLNYNGETGALRLEIDYLTTSFLPPGRHFYDVDVKNRYTNFVDKIVRGTFEVIGEVTRGEFVEEELEDTDGPNRPIGIDPDTTTTDVPDANPTTP